jgi:hypothetical protein
MAKKGTQFQDRLYFGVGTAGADAAARHMRRRLSPGSALFRGGSVEGSPLLLHFCTTALRAFDLVFFVFGDTHNHGKLFVTGVAKIFVVGHGFLPAKLAGHRES